MHFNMKSTLKDNHNHILKHPLKTTLKNSPWYHLVLICWKRHQMGLYMGLIVYLA
jgi:hypothetical protein